MHSQIRIPEPHPWAHHDDFYHTNVDIDIGLSPVLLRRLEGVETALAAVGDCRPPVDVLELQHDSDALRRAPCCVPTMYPPSYVPGRSQS